MSFEVLMRDCAAEEDRQQRYAEALSREEDRLTRETLALARAGDYSRIFGAMDYRDNDQMVLRALVLCAEKGNVEARDALATLARTWAELNAEVE